MSDESDIEIVYVKDTRPKQAPKNVVEFFMNELSLQSLHDDLSPAVLKRVLEKYEVEATESQIHDMIKIAKDKGLQYIFDAGKKT